MRRQNDTRASGSRMPQESIHGPGQDIQHDSKHFRRLIRAFEEKDDALMITDINGVIEHATPPSNA